MLLALASTLVLLVLASTLVLLVLVRGLMLRFVLPPQLVAEMLVLAVLLGLDACGAALAPMSDLLLHSDTPRNWLRGAAAFGSFGEEFGWPLRVAAAFGLFGEEFGWLLCCCGLPRGGERTSWGEGGAWRYSLGGEGGGAGSIIWGGGE